MFMKKLTAAIVLIAIGAALIGGGTFAYFSATVESTGNTFATGTIDIAGSNVNEKKFVINPAKPGDDFEGIYTILNSGTLPANLTLTFNYTANDAGIGTPGETDLGYILEITTFTFGGKVIPIIDANGNGYSDLQDINGKIFDLEQIEAGMTNGIDLVIQGTFRETGSSQNGYMGDSIEATFYFEAKSIVP